MTKMNYSGFLFHVSPWLLLSGLWGIYGFNCVQQNLHDHPSVVQYIIVTDEEHSFDPTSLESTRAEQFVEQSLEDVSGFDGIILSPSAPINGDTVSFGI